jgi:hypothetical protein
VTRTYGNRESGAACDPNCAGCRLSLILLTSVLVVIPFVFSPRPLVAETKGSAPKQHFACNVGYTLQECQVASTVLRKALARYPVDALGEWTWVLLRTEDWKQILTERRFDSNHPAFSYLPKRETFLDGALVVRASIRGVELSAIWHMPIEDLLDLAIRHELVHALCNDPDETKADRAAIALKNGTPLSCNPLLAHSRQHLLSHLISLADEERSDWHFGECGIGTFI